jgi:hypothetical protein
MFLEVAEIIYSYVMNCDITFQFDTRFNSKPIISSYEGFSQNHGTLLRNGTA